MTKNVWRGAIALFAGVLIGVLVQPIIAGDNIYNQMKKYEYILNTAMKNYVDEVDSDKLTEGAIKGMLNELDPHSVYIDAEEMKKVEEDFQGSFEGIGVQFEVLNDTITVVAAISDGPSEKVGIQAGDKIIKIDGEKAVGMKQDEVPKKLRGAKGTIVKLDIKRGNDHNLLSFEIVRDKIPLYTVDAAYKMDNSDVGVIVVNRFAATTFDEMMEAARKLKSQGMKKLVLDLRNNPGGYLNQAFYMADAFLGREDTIVYTLGRRPEFNEAFVSKPGDELEDIPLVVLINEGSASASEIVSGALQDLDRGLIVGETSFGKGLVQRQYPVGDGSAFRLTISRYYTPSGRSIQRPYKDKEEYRRLFGRLELEEGLNLDHTLEKLKKEGNSDKINFDSIEVYHTRSGRMVLGGGGITPDYIIKQDTLTKFAVQLLSKRVLSEYVINGLQNGADLKKKYGENFSDFHKNFQVTDQMVADIRKLAESKGVEWSDKDFKTDADYIKTVIKAQLARSMWDRNRYIEVYFDIDRQMQKALSLFPEAEKIARLRK